MTGYQTCVKCPPGHKCPTNNAAPIRCAYDEAAPAGSTACTTCGAGLVATSSEVCWTCDTGWTEFGGEGI